ncbi:MAG: Trk system potassium transporter TrkA [Desulfobulbus propionicus]|nr:MAG: Trk system potassium transporter TrkA [Desulfobulbus propionicus]
MIFNKTTSSQENILILGLGGIGSYLAKRLANEGYAVTAIEQNQEVLRHTDASLDIRLIPGNALSMECWREANSRTMDYLIAVTDNDAVNMLAAMVADRFGIERKIARVRSLDFGQENCLLRGEDLNIDLFIHPEELTAQEIVRLIRRAAGNEIIEVALGQMQVVGTRIRNDSPFANKTLIELSKIHNKFPFRVVAISRGITTIIPAGHHEILPQDQILIMADSEHLSALMDLVGVQKERRQRVMIIGGGLVGSRVAELLGRDVKVKVLEKDQHRAEELISQLSDTEILHGDGSNQAVLLEAGLLEMDTCIVATGENETNIMTSLLVKHLLATEKPDQESMKTICLVNKEDYLVLASTSGIDIALNKKILAANQIITDIRRSEMISVSQMHGFDAEVADLLAGPGSPITKAPLLQMDELLADHIIIGSVFRDGKWETAIGSTHIQAGDRVIVICNADYINEVRRLFGA